VTNMQVRAVGRLGLEPRTYGLKERPAIVRKRPTPCVPAGQTLLAIRSHPPNAVVGRRRGCHRGCHHARPRVHGSRQERGPRKRPGRTLRTSARLAESSTARHRPSLRDGGPPEPNALPATEADAAAHGSLPGRYHLGPCSQESDSLSAAAGRRPRPRQRRRYSPSPGHQLKASNIPGILDEGRRPRPLTLPRDADEFPTNEARADIRLQTSSADEPR